MVEEDLVEMEVMEIQRMKVEAVVVDTAEMEEKVIMLVVEGEDTEDVVEMQIRR